MSVQWTGGKRGVYEELGMVQLFAYRLSLRILALAVFSVALAAIATPASARSHHGASRRFHSHHHSYHRHHHFGRHYGSRHSGRHVARLSQGDADASANIISAGSPVASANSSFGSSNIVSVARRYIGGNPTGRSSLWCARFMNFVLQRSGLHGTNSDMASSFAHYGHRISGPQVGAIAVMGRRGGGHVGVVSGIDDHGNPIVVSGNHGHRVAESVYSRSRIYAYVMPTS
jgi:uncharacterized protein (TIGR02594 family)